MPDWDAPGNVGKLTDLKARGLLDSTLLVWHGEFGYKAEQQPIA